MKKILPILLTATLLFACKENNNEQIVNTELSEAIDITGQVVYDLNAATSSIEWRGVSYLAQTIIMVQYNLN